MFLQLNTTNFRKLTNRIFHFTEGLNVIRGLNEEGKSTLLEALAYAMFGVEALREPLADVVTWGEKEASLKVELLFMVNGDQYRIKRGKSGAEIYLETKLVATGQTEVSRYVGALLGAAPKLASKLMLATQASLRGALAEGPTATAQLIEKLSNFSVIDEVIGLVQEKLPTGSDAALQQHLKTLSEQMTAAEPVKPDQTEQEAKLQELGRGIEKTLTELQTARDELVPAKIEAEKVRAWARGLENATRGLQQAEADIARNQAALASLNPVCSVSQEELVRLRKWLSDSVSMASAVLADKALKALVKPDPLWEGSRADFDAAVAKASSDLEERIRELNQIEVDIATVSGRIIKETSCAFCGKDLTDVPEVTEHNGPLQERLADLKTHYARITQIRREMGEEVQAYRQIAEADRAFAKIYAKHSQYIKLLDDSVPPSYEWVGPDLNAAVMAGASAALAAAESEVTRANRDQGRKDNLEAELTRLAVVRQESQRWVDELKPKVEGNKAGSLESDLEGVIRYHEERLRTQRQEVDAISTAMATTNQLYEMSKASYARLQGLHAQTLLDLEQLQKNNVLLRKLRGARPIVADKLWSTVLNTVGHYFSGTRGVPSVVTRDEDGFKVDGKPVPGLSGSTLDALGLGIRIGLTKTFLPNNDFLILDEPAAACDDERETNMLGVITTAGFEQVLLVTHSTLADAFAAQVITL